MADTRDLKSLAKFLAYGFESRLRHHAKFSLCLLDGARIFLIYSAPISRAISSVG